MKINLHHIILLAVTLAVHAAAPRMGFAQDSEHKFSRDYTTPTTPSDVENNDELYNMVNDERDLIRTAPTSYAPKDSMVSKTPAYRGRNMEQNKTTGENIKPSDRQKEDKDERESILSFNFIYYIFQKFKLSDIVDDK